MGTLRSKVRHDEPINGVVLGEPRITLADGSEPEVGTAIADLFFSWNDAALPDGELLAGGMIVVDETSGV